MCGIAGIIGGKATKEILYKMLAAQKHRGPDYTGEALAENKFALGHNRLSIIDLSAAANQPFESDCKRYLIVFNGEIYNYRELKSELKSNYNFRTSSDTEVLLNAYKEWGSECMARFNGMFSFAIWDKQEEKLFAARDRFGVKPFYYSMQQDSLFFASEINAFFASGIKKEPRKTLWASFLTQGHYGTPTETFWNDVQQLQPGYYLEFKKGKINFSKWYDFVENINELLPVSKENEEDYITELLLDAIRLRFRADVPVGFNVSGGLDSSILLALIDHEFKADSKSIETFTFYTGDDRYDELFWVEQMLKGKEYPFNKCLLTPNEIPEKATAMAHLQAEPFGGIPTLAYSEVFKTARAKGVKVLLDGQGSDEAWAGYDYYVKNNGAVIQGVSQSPFKTNVLQQDFLKLSDKIVYEKPFSDQLLNLQYRDLFFTKIPRALRFNDRVSMMHGTELREPFLDYRLVEYVFSRPADFKIKNGQQKWLLRKIANKYLNKEVALAPKRPLQTPQREWLANELQAWVRSVVGTLENQEWFDKKELRNELESYFKGNQESSFHIWQWVNLGLLLNE
ncbi:asparagine synthetase [Flavobacterium cauense R2A-7]|uniref:asparagine synthase (glutamine-hydrolyzing) n=1 Tax=Flavobacterium cauense R2A-7 TaxID=1341154 RepID=V6S8S5_9FLAO|nr:asparagine synthase (glutamine-hydrolyzing) [Flavobacterium cauense]ESU20790.1 asparagine synthetase [Flavobacterium cauense R2A-7]KGO82841.1 asparagine synthetase [Flavobacterium cauense R2A-7]TWI12130.1 asparagine synthase (glutamine-hydrolysing) [Flavobacterium cauense R2A-7]